MTLTKADDEDDAMDMAMATTKSPTRNEQEQLKRGCLQRDGHRCVYTGLMDMDSYKDDLAYRDKQISSLMAPSARTFFPLLYL